jgi:hypothetical protein
VGSLASIIDRKLFDSVQILSLRIGTNQAVVIYKVYQAVTSCLAAAQLKRFTHVLLLEWIERAQEFTEASRR